MSKRGIVYAISAVILVTVISCSRSDLSTMKAKYSYAIGQQVGSNIKRQGIDLDTEAFKLALEDAIKGNPSRIKPEEIGKVMREMAHKMKGKSNPELAEKNKKAGEAFLAQNRTKKGVVVTQSGLQYEILKQGEGSRPKATDKVKVHYRGTLISGAEFDSSFKRNKPAEFRVNRLIPGWTEALQIMNTGSKFKLTIPGNLAYGNRGNPGIPPNSVLVFELELLEILKK